MKRISTLVLILILIFGAVPARADEITPPEAETTTPGAEETTTGDEIIPPVEEGSENIEMFSEPSSTPPTEVECYYDNNQNLWCRYSDGTTTIKTSNPFFAKLAEYERTSNFITLSASINGTTIQANGPNSIPLNTPVDIKVSFSRSRENETFAPYQDIPLVFNDVLGAMRPQFFFLRGEPGNAESLAVNSSGYGATEFENGSFSFDKPGHYFIVATSGYYPGRYVPKLDIADWCGGNPDGCNAPQFSVSHFLHFLLTGIRDEGNTLGEGLIDPVFYGVIEFDVVDTPKESSVLFLPGIKGSKLWMGKNGCDFLIFGDCDEESLWAPGGHQDIRDLFLNSEGHSLNKVYTKKNQVLDTAYHIADFYKSFLEMLSSLKTNGTINDFEAVPYDWRLSLDEIVNKGAEHDGKIFYEESTSTPYIEQELRRLAATSQTGKVTIIAHSNGGLVAKELLKKIGDTETSKLVDNLIMVGVPQSGAPQAVGALLFGYGEALPYDFCSSGITGLFCSLFSSRDLARTLAENSPTSYHLLPTSRYFAQLQDTDHPVVKFSGLHAYAQDFALYGDTIDNWSELARFLEADGSTRNKPEANDILHPNVLNSFFLNYAENIHASGLDAWTPPAGVDVYQIAGWGVDTISGVEFTEQPTPYLEYIPLYRPMFVEDGDGVVPIPSALMIPVSQNVKRFWIDLDKFKKENNSEIKHDKLFELESIRIFIKNILNKTDTLPDFISSTQPPTSNASKKLRFILYAQAALKIEDEEGNTTGPKEDGTIEISIPDSNYDEFGGTKIITIPQKKSTYKVTIQATTTVEKITLDIEKVQGNTVVKRSTVTNVPISSGQDISFEVEEGEESVTPLTIENTSQNLIAFNEGETVVYGMATSSPSNETPSGSDSNTPVIPPANETATSSEIHHSTTKIIKENKYQQSESTIKKEPTTPPHKEETRAAVATSTHASRTQTASVYDAFVHSALWLKDLLYTIPRLLSNFFHISFPL